MPQKILHFHSSLILIATFSAYISVYEIPDFKDSKNQYYYSNLPIVHTEDHTGRSLVQEVDIRKYRYEVAHKIAEDLENIFKLYMI